MPHKTVIPNKGHSLYILNSTAKIVTKEMMNFCLNLLQVSHKGENSFAGLIDSELHTKTQSDIISLYTHVVSNIFGEEEQHSQCLTFSRMQSLDVISTSHRYRYISCIHYSKKQRKNRGHSTIKTLHLAEFVRFNYIGSPKYSIQHSIVLRSQLILNKLDTENVSRMTTFL